MTVSRIVARGVRSACLAATLAVGLAAVPAHAQSQGQPTSGYDKGFFIRSDNFEIHIGTRTQLQYSATMPDTFMYDSLLGQEDDTDVANELSVRRFKLIFNGFAHKPWIKWKVQVDVERFRAGGGSAGNLRLEEAFVELTQKPWTQVRIGQFKVPYGYEKMTSSGKLNLVDRSIVHSFFGVNQEPGVALFGQSFDKKIRYDVAVTTGVADNNGFNTRNDLDANGKSDFRYMARVTWEPLNAYSWEQGAVSAPEKAELSLQLGAMTNRTTIPQDADPFLPKDRILPFKRDVLGANSPDFDGTTDALLASWTGVSQSRKAYNRNEAELVAAFKIRGFSIEGQGVTGTVKPELKYLRAFNSNLDDIDIRNCGARLQAGIFLLPTRLEVAGRAATVDRRARAKFETDPDVKERILQREYRLGHNWYFAKHDWKWQFDVGQIGTEWKLNGRKLEVPERSQFPGPPVGTGFDDRTIQRNERKDKEFRTQFQFQF